MQGLAKQGVSITIYAVDNTYSELYFCTREAENVQVQLYLR